MRAAAVDGIPARVGPTMFTPGAMEWHAAHPGGVPLKSARPSSAGLFDAAVAGGAPILAPGMAEPFTRIGRGGHPWVSIRLTQVRNATTLSISASESLRFGMSRPSLSSE